MALKPMLAGKVENVNDLRYPVLASPKLDGIRGTMQGGVLLSRSLKPIANKNVQEKFKNLPEKIDGEFIVGPATAKNVYQRTNSVIMSHDKPADDVTFYAFDLLVSTAFAPRYQAMKQLAEHRPDVVVVPQVTINNAEDLLAVEAAWLEDGYEGVMVRDPSSLYKHGRSSTKEGILLKLKRFEDAEAEIIGCYEEMKNNNEEFRNELGRTARSTAKAGLVGKGTLGGFGVRDLVSGVEFEVGSGFDAAQRKDFWSRRETLRGKIIKYKSFKIGVKDKPRHPIFLGFRDKADM
jgi:DNA ligase-1